MRFEQILQPLLDHTPPALAVLFCDDEGELVAMASAPGAPLDPYELRVLGASGAAWLHTVTRVGERESQAVRLQLRYAQLQVLLEGLPGHYYVMAVVAGSAPAAALVPALHRVAAATRAEM